MEVTDAHWHPTDKDMVMTSALDGSLRLWLLTGEALFGKLMNKHVLKLRSATGQQRIGANCCAFSPDGKTSICADIYSSIGTLLWVDVPSCSAPPFVAVTYPLCLHSGHAVAGGASDGSIHIWNIHNKKTFSRPDTVHRHSTPPCADSPITRLLFSEDGAALAARCEEGSICLWDLKSKKATAPSKILRNIPNVYSYSSMTFRCAD